MIAYSYFERNMLFFRKNHIRNDIFYIFARTFKS